MSKGSLMLMKKLIETTKNNIEVFIGEETIKHMEAHSDVSIKHIKDAIKKITLNGTFFIRYVKNICDFSHRMN